MAVMGQCRHGNRYDDPAVPCLECIAEREEAARREKGRTDEIRRIAREELEKMIQEGCFDKPRY